MPLPTFDSVEYFRVLVRYNAFSYNAFTGIPLSCIISTRPTLQLHRQIILSVAISYPWLSSFLLMVRVQLIDSKDFLVGRRTGGRLKGVQLVGRIFEVLACLCKACCCVVAIILTNDTKYDNDDDNDDGIYAPFLLPGLTLVRLLPPTTMLRCFWVSNVATSKSKYNQRPNTSMPCSFLCEEEPIVNRR